MQTPSYLTANEIAELRTRLGWTQEQLAKLFRVNTRTIQHWEAGSTTPDQYQAATLLQLKIRFEMAVKKKREEQFMNELKNLFAHMVFGAGIGLLLSFLFSEKKT